MISKMIGFEHNMNLILPDLGVRVFGQGFTIQDLTPKIPLISSWFIYFTGKLIPPFWFSFVAFVVFGLIYFKIRSAGRKLVGLRQGRDGEKAVGQYLEHLRELGYKVFHDIPGDGFNLDHVIIGKSSVYVIETKTYSKPDRGQTRVISMGFGPLSVRRHQLIKYINE